MSIYRDTLCRKNSHFLSKDEEGRWELWVLVDEVDGGLVDEGGLAFRGQDTPLFLVETDVGIEPHTQQGNHLMDRENMVVDPL